MLENDKQYLKPEELERKMKNIMISYATKLKKNL